MLLEKHLDEGYYAAHSAVQGNACFETLSNKLI